MIGPKKRPISAVPRDCRTNSPTRIADRDRQHEGREARLDDRQALDRRQHRDRRRDHAVAEEQRGRQHAEHHQPVGPAPAAGAALDQREQRQAAALALIVRAQDQQDIFERDDHDQRPEDQAEHAEDVQRIDGQRVMADEDFLHRVERARADIAIDDADRAHRERDQPGLAVAVSVMPAMRDRCVGDGCAGSRSSTDGPCRMDLALRIACLPIFPAPASGTTMRGA